MKFIIVFGNKCTFGPSSMVQFMISHISTKEYEVVPSSAGSGFDQVICGMNLLRVLAQRQRKEMRKNILTLIWEKTK